MALFQDCHNHPYIMVKNKSIDYAIVTFAISMVVNAVVTIMIVLRIWTLSNRLNVILGSTRESSSNNSPYKIVISMLLESGLTIFIAQLVLLALYVTISPGYNVIVGIVTQLFVRLMSYYL